MLYPLSYKGSGPRSVAVARTRPKRAAFIVAGLTPGDMRRNMWYLDARMEVRTLREGSPGML